MLKRTIGIEEEFCLVAGNGGKMKFCENEIVRSADSELQDSLRLETKRGMIEITTEPLSCWAELAGAVYDNRRRLTELAHAQGARIAAIGVHPWQDARQLPLSHGSERYQRLAVEQGSLVNNWMVCSTHYHVGMDDRETAYQLSKRLMRYTPLFLAASANSAFFHGVDTGFCSWRYAGLLRQIPRTGIMPVFDNYAEYIRHLDELISAGAMEDYRQAWYDLRVSPKYCTVELRLCDANADVGRVAALGVLFRNICSMELARLQSGIAAPADSPAIIANNLYQAAHCGMAATLVWESEPQSLREVFAGVLHQAGEFFAGDEDALEVLLDSLGGVSPAEEFRRITENIGLSAALQAVADATEGNSYE